jgi:hypothetical protein
VKTLDSAITGLLAARGGLVVKHAVWISARNRSTGAAETLGVWSGDYDLSVTISGAPRTYAPAGAALVVPPIAAAPGLAVRAIRLGLVSIDPAVEAIVRDYDTRFAPVEIHRAVINPATRQIAAAPYRVFRGVINALEFPRPEPGGLAEVSLELVSETRALTRVLPTKKSDDSQGRRGTDRIRKYGDISGSVPVYWGEMKAEAPGAPAPTQPAASTGGTTEYNPEWDWGP